MTDSNHIDTYNGDTVHDMWVDFDNYENTDYPDVFDEEELRQADSRYPDRDNFIYNI